MTDKKQKLEKLSKEEIERLTLEDAGDFLLSLTEIKSQTEINRYKDLNNYRGSYVNRLIELHNKEGMSKERLEYIKKLFDIIDFYYKEYVSGKFGDKNDK